MQELDRWVGFLKPRSASSFILSVPPSGNHPSSPLPPFLCVRFHDGGRVFLHHVASDLTVAKPELVEFVQTETVESAIKALGDCTEGSLPVWRPRSQTEVDNKIPESGEARVQRFVGILSSLDVIALLARESSLEDEQAALNTPVSAIVVPNASLLKWVAAETRLLDALELMKQGVRYLLVPQISGFCKGMSKRFCVHYHGKWVNNIDKTTGAGLSSCNGISKSSDSFCCLSREDILRFLISYLGALAPLPLSSISYLDSVSLNFLSVDASSPAITATKANGHDPTVVAVVESLDQAGNQLKIIGEISASNLVKCDYLTAAWALANQSAGEFIMSVHEHASLFISKIDTNADNTGEHGHTSGARRFRRISRARSAPLTCKTTSSLAAVMAQMLAHRATHVWVTDDRQVERQDVLVGIVTYTDILRAVTHIGLPATLSHLDLPRCEKI